MRDAVHPDKQVMAAHWLDLLWREQRGRTSHQVLNESYVTVTRKLKPGMRVEDARDDVETLLAWDPQPTDRELLLRPRKVEQRYRLGWWDSLIIAAAQLQDCDTLLTEDLQPGMVFGEVTAQSPFQPVAGESRASYAVDSGIARRHRPRGRPRKRSGTAP